MTGNELKILSQFLSGIVAEKEKENLVDTGEVYNDVNDVALASLTSKIKRGRRALFSLLLPDGLNGVKIAVKTKENKVVEIDDLILALRMLKNGGVSEVIIRRQKDGENGGD